MPYKADGTYVDPITSALDHVEATLAEDGSSAEDVAFAKGVLNGMFMVWESQAQNGGGIDRHPEFTRHARLSLRVAEMAS
jgi:hypothetical protein